MSALISVVIPTYNHAHFLGKALRSVVDQTYGNWEALVVDNHSQDDTREVVRSFADPRIQLLEIHNQGVIAASRNMGMRAARGDWIAFLDSDDCWYPRKLEVLMAAVHADPGLDVLSCDELQVDGRTGETRELRYGPHEENFYRVLLLEGNRLSPSATMVRREFLTRHNLSFGEKPAHATVEDYGLWLDLARHGARFHFIHQLQGEFLLHGANTSAQWERHLNSQEALLRDHIFSIQTFDLAKRRLWRVVSCRLQLAQARILAATGKRRLALRLVVQAVARSPRGVGVYLVARVKRFYRFRQ